MHQREAAFVQYQHFPSTRAATAGGRDGFFVDIGFDGTPFRCDLPGGWFGFHLEHRVSWSRRHRTACSEPSMNAVASR
jgi:hypothetical protein